MNMKKPLIIGGVLVALGSAMALVAAPQANFNLAWHKGLKVADIKKQTVTPKQINKVTDMDIDVGSQEVRVERGNAWRVETISVDGHRADVTVDGHTLKVKTMKDPYDGRYFMSSTEAGVVITVPKGAELDQLKITGRDGGIKIHDVNVKHIEANLADGGVNLSKLDLDSFKGRFTDGRVAMEQVKLERLDIKGEDLYVNGQDVQVATESQVELLDGSVHLYELRVPGIKTNVSRAGNVDVTLGKKHLYEDEVIYSYEHGDQENALTIKGRDTQVDLGLVADDATEK